MRALFYDTETSGMPLFHEPSEDPRQPHIVQLGASLVDIDKRSIISTLDVIIEPAGWEIPEEVAAVHGITTEHAQAVGVPEHLALQMLLAMWYRAELRVGHNETFDARMVRIGLKRHQHPTFIDPDVWKAAPAYCTATRSTKICNLPPSPKMIAAGRRNAKTPNLAEAYEFFTGRKLEGAHNALVDVDACMAVYFAIIDREQPPA
jgi:DNA polymerase-3 subunit epsilon